MKVQEVHYAQNTITNSVQIYGTQFVPCSNTKPDRFVYQQTNLFFDKQAKAVTKSWHYGAKSRSHADQLLHHLGPDWRVISPSDVEQAIINAQKLAI